MRDRDGKQIAELFDQGWSEWQIATELGLSCGTVQYIVGQLRRERGEVLTMASTRRDCLGPKELARLRRELLAWWRRSGLTWTAMAAEIGQPVQTIGRFRDGRHVPGRASLDRIENYLRKHGADLEG